MVLSQDGVEKYRWSEGLLFTEAIKTVALQPGEVYPVAIYDTLDVPAGPVRSDGLDSGHGHRER